MAEFRISVQIPAIKGVERIINSQVFPLLDQAVRVVSQATQAQWIESVQRAKLWSGEKDAYAATIKVRPGDGTFSAVVYSDYKYAEDIENGRPARDLKQMLNTSLKTRVSKKGKRYLIIPFRHNTPGSDALAPAMPPSVYAIAQQLKPSRVTGMGQRPSHLPGKTHVMVPQRKYKWGASLDAIGLTRAYNSAFGGAAGNVSEKMMSRYQGMYRFNTSSGKQKSSTYLTFRVMTEDSPGWIIPPQPGQHIAQGVAEKMQPIAEAAFKEAINRSV